MSNYENFESGLDHEQDQDLNPNPNPDPDPNPELNHPWFIYPRGIMSEYNEYNLYRKESIKLSKYVKNLPRYIDETHTNKESLVSFIIGSSMEDVLANSANSANSTNCANYAYENIIHQYRQLFPNYINDFINTNTEKKFIQIIITSPDRIFSNDDFTPQFITYEPYNFRKIQKNEYVFECDMFEIKINIFNCPMPCLETRYELVTRYQRSLDMLKVNPYDIQTYKQTQTDVDFIHNFYSSIEELFKITFDPRNKIIINSWVSFANLDGYSEKYNMFPNILELANKYNIIATEWEFTCKFTCGFTKIVSKYTLGNKCFQNHYIRYTESSNSSSSSSGTSSSSSSSCGTSSNTSTLYNYDNLPKNLFVINFI